MEKFILCKQIFVHTNEPLRNVTLKNILCKFKHKLNKLRKSKFIMRHWKDNVRNQFCSVLVFDLNFYNCLVKIYNFFGSSNPIDCLEKVAFHFTEFYKGSLIRVFVNTAWKRHISFPCIIKFFADARWSKRKKFRRCIFEYTRRTTRHVLEQASSRGRHLDLYIKPIVLRLVFWPPFGYEPNNHCGNRKS